MKKKLQEMYLRGVPICRGIVIGKPFFFAFVEDDVPEFFITATDVENEVRRYQLAVERSKEDVERLKKQLEEERIIEGAAILEAHQQMMQDPLLTFEVEENIRSLKKNAEFVFQNVIKSYQKKFSTMSDPFFRERFKDLQDISRRVMNYLRESVHFTLADIPEGSIIFAPEFTPSDIAEANKAYVSALVAASGGATSHAAIVAKAKGIPYVANVNFENLDLNKETVVIVDGRVGDIILNPTKETLAHYEQIRDHLNRHIFKLDEAVTLNAETYDGYSVKLSANIDMVNEAELLHKYGGSGVGLFRSEFVFMAKDSFPTEEQQFDIYRDIVEKMQGLPIVIRTFDIGGDKQIPSRKFNPESNPYLGCRAIRFLLKEQEIFKIQLRAILRASAYGDVSVMFPMISTLSELIEAKNLVYETITDLRKKGYPIAPSIRIGCMVEVPSAAIISDLLAKECDFLSIGTNDLVQYALAVDRDNHAMSSLYSPTHPSVLRLIKLVVSEANHQGIPVTVCGEVASDPRFTPLLLGLGVHELSVASRFIPIVKNAIRNTSIVEASRLAEKVMGLSTSLEIEELLNQDYKLNVPEDCFFNC
jgi:phosphotransferase system enzyme I (PtsI)